MGNSAEPLIQLIMGMFNITLVAADNSANNTTISFNSLFVQSVALPTAGELVSFPTANAVIVYLERDQNEQRARRYLTASTVAAVNALILASGSTGAVGTSGDATLVSGTVDVTISGLTTASKVQLTRHTAGGTVTSTIEYFYVVAANTLTITAAVAAGTINTADNSVITYTVVA